MKINNDDGKAGTGAGLPEQYKPGQLTNIEEYITVQPGLGQSLVPYVQRLSTCGFSKMQLDSIVNIACDDTKPEGRTGKVKALLESIADHYSPVDLKNMTRDFRKFKEFEDLVQRTEVFRDETQFYDEHGYQIKLSYDHCLLLMDELEEERARELVSGLINYCRNDEGINSGKVFYLLERLSEESIRTRASIDVIFEDLKKSDELSGS